MLPIVFLLCFFVLLFRQFFFFGQIPAPFDALIGSYLPWLDYKWGYVVGVPVKNAMLSDIFSYFFVFKDISISILKEGMIPFWNRYILSGTPLLGTYHSSVLFPLNLLFLFPKYSGWGLFIFLSSFCSALSFYLFISRHISNRYSRIIGSIVFALAGPMTTWSQFGTAVWAMSFLPLLLFFIDSYIKTSKPKNLIFISLTTCLLILSGNVQIDIYTSVILLFYVLYRYFQSSKKDLTQVLWILFFYGVGIGLASIQLIPTYLFFSQSIRPEFTPTSLNYGLIDAFQLVRLWVADFFGHPATYNEFSPYYYHEYINYLGALSLPIILPLYFQKTSKPSIFFKWVFLGSLFISVYSPFTKYIFSQPLPLLTYSGASRIFFLTTLSGAVLVSFGIEQLASKKFSYHLIYSLVLFFILTLVCICLVDQQYRNISLRNSAIPLTFIVTLFLCLLFKLKKHFIYPLLLLVFSFDLGRYYQKYNPFVSPSFVYPETPAIEYLKKQTGLFRVARGKGITLPPNTWAAYGLESIEGLDPLHLSTYNHFFHVVDNKEYFNSVSAYLELEDFRPNYIDALNVKYFIVEKTPSQSSPSAILSRINNSKYPLVFSDGRTQIYQNPNSKERAYFISEYQIASDKNQLSKILESKDYDPKKSIVLPEGNYPTNLSVGTIDSIEYQPNTVKIIAQSTTDSILVLADSFVSGWTARIDGVDTEIFPANGALRSVIFPKGKHTLIFNYVPTGFVIGLKTSLFCLFALFVSSVYSYFKKISNKPSKNQD